MRAVGDAGPQVSQGRGELHERRRHQVQLAIGRQREDRLGFRSRHRDRLLAHHVLASLEGDAREVGVRLAAA